ncbi:hypothetical protein TNCV_4267221 [Trichonephila clavipes]|nr:hypothetical protein TNCV_4267221 [Trichonephila clavipes]
MVNNQSVRRHLDAFTRGRIIGKLEEGRSVTKCGCRVWNCSQHRFTTLETISNYRKQLSGGSVVVVHEEPHPQMTGTLLLQARRNRRQTAGEIARHTTQATGRPISRFTVARRSARWWSVCTTPCTVCTFNACPSEKAFSVVPGTPELERQ